MFVENQTFIIACIEKYTQEQLYQISVCSVFLGEKGKKWKWFSKPKVKINTKSNNTNNICKL